MNATLRLKGSIFISFVAALVVVLLFAGSYALAVTGDAQVGGSAPPSGPQSEIWGDIDCSGSINPIDSLKTLRFDAGLSAQKVDPTCPDLGGLVTLGGSTPAPTATLSPTATPQPTDTGGPGGSHSQILHDVIERGLLNCGVNDSLPGFGELLGGGTFAGFDIDYCRAIAAAVLGDAEAVNYTPLSAGTRFIAVQTGQVDVLIRNSTWTTSRDASLGVTFATTTFYDGQGMMVRADSGFTSIDELATATICVLQGIAKVHLADRLPNAGALVFEDNNTLQQAFIEERCDGWTSDKTILAFHRSAFPSAFPASGPGSLVILSETFTEEPLGPVTIDNDAQWSDIVNWVVIGTIAAEKLGVTSANVAAMAAIPPNISVARLLGVGFEGGEVTDTGLDVDVAFMQDVLPQVGNYGEIYAANVTPVGLERAGTLNALWTDGGLIYSPPFR